jgi:hypothetical protein
MHITLVASLIYDSLLHACLGLEYLTPLIDTTGHGYMLSSVCVHMCHEFIEFSSSAYDSAGIALFLQCFERF